jgi:hypothetical protein
MKNPRELYLISEPESPTAAPAADVVPIDISPAVADDAETPEPRERSWRDLMRRMQKKTA